MVNPLSISPDSWLHHGQRYQGDELCAEMERHVTELNPKAAEHFKAHKLWENALNDSRTHNLPFDELSQAFKAVATEKLGLEKVKDIGDNAVFVDFAARRKRIEAIESGKVDLNKISVDDLLKQCTKNTPNKPLSTIVASNSVWERTTTGQKVNAGMWGIGAVLGAFGALGAARYSVVRDDQNKAHVQWSQVGVCLLQAAMTAGCAYMGYAALHGRSVV